jgi:hypothetical protein
LLTGTQAFAQSRSFPRQSPSTQQQEEEAGTGAGTEGQAADFRFDVPIAAFAYSAFGAPGRSLGVQAYAQTLNAADQSAVLGGGGSIFWAPVDRLTLIADGQRNIYGNFSPSAAVLFRALGDREAGWSLAALGKFKIDGFASGPDHDEVESEVEIGALASFARAGWFVDANSIVGRGTGDDGEVDVEGRLRLGRDVTRTLRLGIDGQARDRVAGPRYLPNGRTWDFAAGAQAVLSVSNFFGSLTAGPTTMGLQSSKVGWTVLASFGAVSF